MKILKKGKRRLALLISLCLAWSLGCYAMSRDHVLYNAYAETGQLSDGTLLYRQSSSMAALIVTGSVQECSGDIVIPVSWSGMNIIEIADEAFSGQTEITGVTVPDTVQRIGAGAFRGCTSLEQVNLENTIQSVGAGAFEDTAWSAAHADDEMMILDELVLISVSDSAEKIYVPDSVRVIADEACMDNTSLKTAVMTEYTGYIGKKSFSGCTGLTEAIFPNGVKSIGDHAFADSMLTRAVIPATVLSVGKSAFLHCTALEQVTLWDGILRIGSNAFSSCTSLKQVTVPDSVTELGSSAFKQCTNLQQVSLGIHVTEIQDYTFQDCTSLSVVSMGSQVKRIGVFSFNKCTALQSITLPDGLVQIGSKAFQSCMSLAGINIPESVLDIGTNAFFDTMFYNDLRAVSSDSSFVVYNGTVLLEYYGEDTIVNVPSGIRVIGGSAFGSNETIETIVLPSSIISLSSYAFENLWTMEQITGMEYLQYVGVYAFVDCISLQTLDLNAVLGTVPEGAAMGCEGLVSVNIDDGITGIEEDAFRFSGLASVLIPQSVGYIETGAFADCAQLGRITILNPECVLDGEFIPAGTEICGYEGSTAYEYALLYGNPFVDIMGIPSMSGTTGVSETTTLSSTTTTSTEETTTTANTSTSHSSTTTDYIGDTPTVGTLEMDTVVISIDELASNNYKVIVPISVLGTDGWKSLGYGFKYDTSQLTVESVSIGGVLLDMVSNDDCKFFHSPAINSQLGIVWSAVGVTGEDIYCPDGVFTNITFSVNPAAEAGDIYVITPLKENNGTETSIDALTGSGSMDLVNGAVVITSSSTATSTTTTTAVTTATTTTTTTATTNMPTYTTQTSSTTETMITTTATTTTTTVPTYTKTQTTATTTMTTTTVPTYTKTQTTATTTVTTTTVPTYTTTRTTCTTTVTTTVTTTLTTCTTTIQTTCTTTQTTQANPSQCGDLDSDGMITISDASSILELYARQAAGLDPDEYYNKWLYAADTDGSGGIEMNDAALVLTYYAQSSAGMIKESFENWRVAQ